MACSTMIALVVIIDEGLPVALAVHLPDMIKLEFFFEVELLHLLYISRLSVFKKLCRTHHLFVNTLITLLPTDIRHARLQIRPDEAKFVDVDVDW